MIDKCYIPDDFTAAGYTYRETSSRPPQSMRFDAPARYQGQMVELSFGIIGKAEAGPGAQWAKRFDRTDRSTTYFLLVG